MCWGTSLLSLAPHFWPRKKKLQKSHQDLTPCKNECGGHLTSKESIQHGLAHGRETKVWVVGKDVSLGPLTYQAGNHGSGGDKPSC